MSGRGKRAKWTAKQKLRMASINGTGATLEPHQVKDVYEAVLAKDSATKAVLDRLTTLAADKGFLSIEEITDALETKR